MEEAGAYCISPLLSLPPTILHRLMTDVVHRPLVSLRRVSLDESVLRKDQTITETSWPFCHSQVYREGAITSREGRITGAPGSRG